MQKSNKNYKNKAVVIISKIAINYQKLGKIKMILIILVNSSNQKDNNKEKI